MPRVLHIGKYFPPFFGGMELFLSDLMGAQLRLGVDPVAIVHDHRTSYKRILSPIQPDKAEKQRIYRVPSFGRLLFAPVSPHFPFWLHRIMKQEKPDVLHLHLPNTSAFHVLWSSTAQSIPWVIQWHSDVDAPNHKLLTIAYSAYKPFEQRLIGQARFVVATSPPYANASTALKPWVRKCRIIPLGVDVKRLSEPSSRAMAWAELNWTQQTVRLISIGRLTYYKGHEVLIQAMARVTGAQALIVGEGERFGELSSLINTLGVGNKVRLLGRCSQDELLGLLKTSDCMCLPSLERTEAFGVVLLEAMRFGKPIVASDIPGSGVPWVVQHGNTGILVAPHDSVALAKHLQAIVDSEALRNKLGSSGLNRFNNHFQIENVALCWKEVYHDAMSRRMR